MPLAIASFLLLFSTAHYAKFFCSGYMAQEYIDRGIITPKADIFSLGVIIIEIITGRMDYPNIGGRTETSLKHFTEEVRLFSIMQHNFPPLLCIFF